MSGWRVAIFLVIIVAVVFSSGCASDIEYRPVLVPCNTVEAPDFGKKPELVKFQRPHYPEFSRVGQEQGRVLVSITVAKDGSVINANLCESSGFAALDQSALSAARDCRYLPGMKNGMAVQMQTVLPFVFSLHTGRVAE